MDTETLQTIVFWTASILYVINSLGTDTYVCLNIRLFQRLLNGKDLANTVPDCEKDCSLKFRQTSIQHQKRDP